MSPAADWPRDHADAARRVLPHLPPGSRARLVPIGAGDDSLAFRQGARVVRVARHAEAAAALAREACVLAEVADRLPLPVPRPRFVDAGAGCAFAVHRHVRGRALTRRGWTRLPADARERTAAQLAEFLGALHAIPPAVGVRCGLPTLDLAATSAALRPSLVRLAPALAARDARRVDDALARWSAAAEAPRALLHRDVAPGHVLYDPRRGALTGVIDFGDLALGDPARDFAYVYDDFGPAMLDAVLARYASEPPAALRRRVLAWYAVEALAWTAERADDAADLAHGAREVARAVAAAV